MIAKWLPRGAWARNRSSLCLRCKRTFHCLPRDYTKQTSYIAIVMSHLASLLLAICTLVTLCSAKFEHNYAGISSEGVQACIDNSNFTRATITLRGNCGNAYACIMDNISNSKQSILSSGTSILALVGVRTLQIQNIIY